MVSVEQVKLLESRIIKTIEFVDTVREENSLLKNKLESCQKRIDELEIIIQRFKEDQAKIEDSIVSALDRLNKFEDDMDRGLSKAKAEVESRSKPASRDAPVPETTAKEMAENTVVEENFVLKEKPYDPQSEGEKTEESADLEIF